MSECRELSMSVKRGAALAAAAVMTMFGAACSDDNDPPRTAPTPAATAGGVRWESFGDIELAVPAEWGHGTGDVAGGQWCISDAAVSRALVIRPGIAVEASCPGPSVAGEPDPATLLERAGAFVSMVAAFSEPGVAQGVEGDRRTLRIGAVLIRVQAAAQVAEDIVSSIRKISVDAHGCPVTDAITAEVTRRPDSPFALADLSGVTRVSVCRYGFDAPDPRGDDELEAAAEARELGLQVPTSEPVPTPTALVAESEPIDIPSPSPSDSEVAAVVTPTETDAAQAPTPSPSESAQAAGSEPAETAGSETTDPVSTAEAELAEESEPPRLLSSLLLTDDAAAAAVAGIAAAPAGTGPDAEFACEDPVLRGAEAIVLRITSSTGLSEVYLRYGGCGNGFDDGAGLRMLTRAAVAPFVGGSNAVPRYSQALAGILDDPDAPATSGDPSLEQEAG
ncbi:MAG: hypothetical protein ACT4PP_12650 [Sporichthyaceae bacterium]